MLPARAADTPQQQLKSLEKQLQDSRDKQAQFAKAAEALAQEIAKLRADSIATAKTAQIHESALSDLEEQLGVLNAEEAQKAAELARHRVQQQQLLMALTRLARNPPEGMALAPGDPLDTVRSALLMGAAVPPLEAQARRLRDEIAGLAQVRQQIAEAQAHERTERSSLDQEQASLSALIARKATLQQEAQQGVEQSNQRYLQLASQAADMQQLIERLDAERRVRDAELQKRRDEQDRVAEAERRDTERLMREQRKARPDERDQGVVVALPPPIIRDPTKPPPAARPFAKARGAAQVVAPYDGRVLFAGAFKGYGQILIIEHGDGYHSLLAGLDRVDGTVGQWLVAGEPVGTMSRGDAKPRLYLELRHDGQPINPLPWLAARDEKVSG
jgi:septal ring factor EnvC (AmiA/AmiB activator)